MTEIKDAWWGMMKAKYGTDEAGVRAIMRERQQKSMAAPNRKPSGFAVMPKERLKEISQKGLEKRYHKDDENQDPAPAH